MKFGKGRKAIVLLLCFTMLMTSGGMTAWAREGENPIPMQQTIEQPDTPAVVEGQEVTEQKDPSVEAPAVGEEDTNGSDLAESKSELMKFLVIETSKVVAPAQQNVVVGLNEHSEKILSAKLTYKEKISGKEKIVDATEITEEALAFQFGFTSEETGAYQISKITYKTEAADYYFDLALVGNAPEFGVNQDVSVEANGVILEPEQVAQRMQNSAALDTVITDTDGKALTKTEIQEAVEAANEATVVTGPDGIVGMDVDKSDVQGISNTVLTNESKEKMIPALKQLDTNVPMRAVPLASVTKPVTIVLDPGHGDNANTASGDPGAWREYDGVRIYERDLVLKIAQYCKQELEKYRNVNVYMTRTTNAPQPLSLQQRADYALSVGADVLVSIHLNAFTNNSAHGALVFIPNKNWRPDIGVIGDAVGKEILSCLSSLGLSISTGTVTKDSDNGGVYADGSTSDYYAIPRLSKKNGFPGIIVEHAFLSNESDYRNFLNTDEKLRNLGIADAMGLVKYYGLVKKTPNTPIITQANRNAEGKVVVNWMAQDDATFFDVYRYDAIGGVGKFVGEVSGDQTSFVDATANKNQTYYYSVQALSQYGSSLWAKYVQTGSEITGTQSYANGQIGINFEKSTVGSGYYIFRRPLGSVNFTQIATINSIQNNSYLDQNVTPGVRYEYTVAVFTSMNGLTYNSAIGELKIGTSMMTPTINSANRESGKVVVRYGAVPGAISYEIYRSTSIDGTYTYLKGTPNSFFLDETAGLGTYYYKVLAVNKECNLVGISSYSKPVQTGSEVMTTQSISSGQILVKFEKATSGTGYYIFRRQQGQPSFSLIATTTNIASNSYIDSAISVGTRYEYLVACYTINMGVIYNSSVGLIKTGLSVATPIIHSANRENGNVIVHFSPVSEAVSYELYRSDTVDGRFDYQKSTSETFFTDDKASNGATYYYKVLAVNKEGDLAGISSLSKAVQTGVEVKSAQMLNDNAITVSWEKTSKGTGYYLFRKAESEKSFQLINTVTDISKTIYTDANIVKNQSYYYLVCPFTRSSGTEYVGAVGQPFKCEPFKAPIINSANYNGTGNLINYSGNSNATSYEIYRCEDVNGRYDYLGCTIDLTYNDISALSGKTYFYKVLAVKSDSGNVKTAFSKPVMNGVSVSTVVSAAPNVLFVKWDPAEGADGYYLFRKLYGGSYQLLATVKNGDTSFFDQTPSSQTVYTYCVAAFKNSSYGLVNSAVSGERAGGLCSTTTVNQVKLVADEKMQLQMQIDWTAVQGATRYIVCRSTDPDYSFSQISVVNAGGACSVFDKTIQLGQTYYYKIIVEQDAVGVTLKSPLSAGKGYSITGNPIMGTTTVTAAQMAAHYKTKSSVAYPAAVYGTAERGAVDTIEKFAQIIVEEANAEGVRAEVVWAQICNETGFLKFAGDVKVEQCNFAGMGAVGGGAPGLTFSNVRTGIRAQVQHLKAYASKLPLNQTCVDPRFSYVPRGGAPYVEWLGIQENPLGKGWAAAPKYGYYLMALVGAVRSY